MIRAFLALDLPDAIRSALAVQQFLLPLPRRVPVENLHLTLAFLGEVPLTVLEDLHDRLQALRLPAFDLALEGLGIFGGARPRVGFAAVAPSDGLTWLHAKVERAAHLAGAPPGRQGFHPHVTLGRFPPPPLDEAMRLERAVAAGAGFRAGPFAVTDYVLYQSHLGPKGARYDEMARYPLD